jgi:putative ABC transport system substrate-binding protein
MRRRDFITLISGAAAGWPVAAPAQQPTGTKRVGVLNTGVDGANSQANLAAFRQGLGKLGWFEGRNILIDIRFGAADPDRIRGYATELVRLKPDVMLTQSSNGVEAVQRASPSVPIVFVQMNDPVGSGVVTSLAHPGGNITGFTPAEFSMGGKMLEVLKDVAPNITQVSGFFNPDQTPGVRTWDAVRAAAQSIGVQATAIGVRNAAEIERAFREFRADPSGGLVVLASAPTTTYRKLIIKLAAQHRLPAVYPYPLFVRDGGLVSYGVEPTDEWGRAASYVDRILKGTKPGDLPVQQPTKFNLVINLTTARALGLTISHEFLLLADEVIE